MASSTYLAESPTHLTENSSDDEYQYVPVETFLDKVMKATIDENIIGKLLLFRAPHYTYLLVIMFLEYLKTLTFEVVDAGTTKLLYRPSSISVFFSALIRRIIRRAGVSMPTIILAIVYLKRASHDILIGDHAKFVAERVFLGALLLSAKVRVPRLLLKEFVMDHTLSIPQKLPSPTNIGSALLRSSASKTLTTSSSNFYSFSTGIYRTLNLIYSMLH